MNEQALLFGPGKSLAAVVSEPAKPSGAPALILLNAGVLHHVGPNRLHVRLARELASRGVLSLRFDLSGLGDSRSRADGTPFAEAVATEAREAMDVLAARGATSFVLGGLCSGADNALRLAAADPRVVGALLVEPMSVPLSGFLVYSYRKKLLSPASWWRLLTGKSELFDTLRARRVQAPPAPAVAEAGSLVPSRAEFVARVDALVRRGVALYFAYSSESPAYVNYRSLLKERLAGEVSAGRARVLVVTRTDHVFTPLEAQRTLVAGIADWIGSLRG